MSEIEETPEQRRAHERLRREQLRRYRNEGRDVTIWQIIGQAVDLLIATLCVFIAIPIALGVTAPLSRQILSVLVFLLVGHSVLSDRATWRDLREEWRRYRARRR